MTDRAAERRPMATIDVTCECGRMYSVPEGRAGQKGKCKACGRTFEVVPPLDEWLAEQPPAPVAFPGPPEPTEWDRPDAPERRRFEYHVLTQKDRWFSARFDPEKLAEAINHYAGMGWRVVSMTTAHFPSGIVGSQRDEIVVLFERERQAL